MMKNFIQKNIVVLFAALFALAMPHRSAAQLVPLFTQYSDLQTFINPAALPSDFLQYQMSSVAGLTSRFQWVGEELSGKKGGAPQTFLAKFDHIYEGNNISSFGGFLMKDRLGPSDIAGIYGRYSYQIRPSMQEDMFIGIGLLAGLLQYRVDNQALEFEPDDQLQANRVQKFVPDFGIGVNFVAYPQRGMKFYTGVSLPQVANLSARFTSRAGEEFVFKRPIHVMGTMGLVIPVGEQGFIEPSMWVKVTKNQPVNVDFNLKQKFVNNFWVGVGVATSKTLHMEIGLILTEMVGLEGSLIRVGYGLDYNAAGYGGFLGVSHEINVNYAFGGDGR